MILNSTHYLSVEQLEDAFTSASEDAATKARDEIVQKFVARFGPIGKDFEMVWLFSGLEPSGSRTRYRQEVAAVRLDVLATQPDELVAHGTLCGFLRVSESGWKAGEWIWPPDMPPGALRVVDADRGMDSLFVRWRDTPLLWRRVA